MNDNRLTLHVPPSFAELVRQREIVRVSLWSIFAFVAAWTIEPPYTWLCAWIGYIMIAKIIVVFAYSKAELIYNLTPSGVWITVPQPVSAAVLRFGLRFWLGWPKNGIVTVEHRYYGDHSVVLLRTKKDDTRMADDVYCLPVAPSDVSLVSEFLLSHSQPSSSDDDKPIDFIK